MNGSAASGLMSIEGGDGHPKLPPMGMINDFITANLAPADPSDQFQQEQRSEPIVGCPDVVPSAKEQSQTCTGDLRLAQRGSSSFHESETS
jgi:hypothetical protein